MPALEVLVDLDHPAHLLADVRAQDLRRDARVVGHADRLADVVAQRRRPRPRRRRRPRSARVAVCRQWVSWSTAKPSVMSREPAEHLEHRVGDPRLVVDGLDGDHPPLLGGGLVHPGEACVAGASRRGWVRSVWSSSSYSSPPRRPRRTQRALWERASDGIERRDGRCGRAAAWRWRATLVLTTVAAALESTVNSPGGRTVAAAGAVGVRRGARPLHRCVRHRLAHPPGRARDPGRVRRRHPVPRPRDHRLQRRQPAVRGPARRLAGDRRAARPRGRGRFAVAGAWAGRILGASVSAARKSVTT